MKQKLREKIMSLRNSHPKEEYEQKSKIIKEKLFKLPEFEKAKTILFYVDIKGEVKTIEMIHNALELGKRVVVPVADFKTKELFLCEIKSIKELEIKKYGLVEPKEEYLRVIDPQQLDLVIVPGLAFDKNGYRVGYGFGFYDKFLSKLHKKVATVGLAFEFQMIEKIPCEEHDVKVQKIVTEKRIIKTS